MAIDADQLRTYHPQWDDLNHQDDRNGAFLNIETHGRLVGRGRRSISVIGSAGDSWKP